MKEKGCFDVAGRDMAWCMEGGLHGGRGMCAVDCYRVFIRDLCCHCRIGIHEREKTTAQRLLISVDMLVRRPVDVASGDITHVVCYETVKDSILSLIASKHHWPLVETLGGVILEHMMVDERICCASLTMEKPDIFDDCRSVGVTLFHARDERHER
ncbi:MAG: dihydroneopterin aldolase [Alphaproteobacteria bacterium GM7ARS4]|nr:dihydroneopterin aldolase [Alphaproteobacteria bacterium GM7ARS4]